VVDRGWRERGRPDHRERLLRPVHGPGPAALHGHSDMEDSAGLVDQAGGCRTRRRVDQLLHERPAQGDGGSHADVASWTVHADTHGLSAPATTATTAATSTWTTRAS
jgi:hypothetical protein